MIGVGTCTPTLGNVVLGNESRLMNLSNLTLAEYRASLSATYPVEFGSCIPFAGQPRPVEPTPPTASSFQSESPALDNTGHSSGYSNIS